MHLYSQGWTTPMQFTSTTLTTRSNKCRRSKTMRLESPYIRVGKFSPISERMLTTLHWLPIAQRIKYKVLCTVHKIMYGASPGYQHELILHGPGNRSANLKVIRFNRHKAKTAFSVGAPFIWNALPVMLKTEAKFAVFKRNLKTHLFREKLN